MPVPLGTDIVRRTYSGFHLLWSTPIVRARQCPFARALLRGDTTDVVTYLVEHYQLLGLVKAQRKRHRDNLARSVQIWTSFA
jgi:hypothetical protein